MSHVLITGADPAPLARREALRPAHVDYLQARPHLLPAAGGMLEDDGPWGNGGVIVLDTEDRAVADACLAGDPFQQAGLFTTVLISRRPKAFFNFEALVQQARIIQARRTFPHMGAVPRV